MDVAIAWKSKTMSRVALSSCEAEFGALSELIKTILFIMHILEHLEIEVELPIKVYIDNIGAIHMARNNSSGVRTKHVNLRYNYCREVCGGPGSLIELIFVKSADNEADIMTKNPTKLEHEKHSVKLVEEVPEFLCHKNKEQEGCQK